jgi:hypothetical protein
MMHPAELPGWARELDPGANAAGSPRQRFQPDRRLGDPDQRGLMIARHRALLLWGDVTVKRSELRRTGKRSAHQYDEPPP